MARYTPAQLESVPSDADLATFAETMLSLATQVWADEDSLWVEVERLAAAGDLEGVRRIAAHRLSAPPSEVAAELGLVRRRP